jgi:hypothetical protein
MAMAMSMAMGMAVRRAERLLMARSTASAARQPPRNWLLRGGIAAVALMLGYVSTTQTLAFALIKSDAERANALAPGDGRVAGALSNKLITSNTRSVQRLRAVKLARQALLNEPLTVPAIDTLAINTLFAGDTSGARHLFVHSSELSRRDLSTRLWLIEDAVNRGDVPGALMHYDIALRTSRTASEVLFPVLSKAIADPEIRSALTKTLSTKPLWGADFLGYLGGSGPEPTVSAQFFERLTIEGVSVPEVARITVVNSLATAGLHENAWSYYRTIRRGASRRQLRDYNFQAPLQTPSVFDWMPVMNEAGVNASVNGGVFDFSVPATVGGTVLQQVEVLPPGNYRFGGMSTGIDQPPESLPYWQLMCIDGRELGRIEIPNSSETNGRFSGVVSIGTDCKVQTLRMVVRASSKVGGVSGQIDRIMIL